MIVKSSALIKHMIPDFFIRINGQTIYYYRVNKK
jgi:hypothetical protein